MSVSNELDDKSQSILRSTAFVNHVDWFLRKEQRFGDTAIRLASNELLKSYANKYCQRYLDMFFPDIRITGVPDAHHIYRKVVRQYQKLKSDLLRRARLRSSSECDHSSELSLSPCSTEEIQSSPIASQSSSQRLVSKKGRRRRRHKTLKRDGEPRSMAPQSFNTGCRPEAVLKVLKSVNEEAAHEDYGTGKTVLSGASYQTVISSRAYSESSSTECASIVSKTAFSQLNEQVEKLKEYNKQLEVENQHLRVENQTLIDHRTFVDTTLRVCQDTYLEEAQSAKRAGIYTQTSQCSGIVDVIRDLRSDLDIKYFSDYYLLNGHAPPSRYWLDGVRKRKQRYDILRS